MLMIVLIFVHKDSDASATLGTVLELCSSWLVDNKLTLHLGKSV